NTNDTSLTPKPLMETGNMLITHIMGSNMRK
ncbi:unnamed protein product, partial [marine sediment metagenome]